MKSELTDRSDVVAALEALRAELARLGDRVAALEAASSARPVEPATAVAHAPASPGDEGLSEELMLVIGAAVAAFLGERGHVRQIRLLASPAWAQQGRVMIQASHARPAPHG